MDTRVVLGSGAPARTLASALVDRNRGRPVHVVAPEEATADRIRDGGGSATVADPTDREALAAVGDASGVVVATPIWHSRACGPPGPRTRRWRW